MSSSANKRSNDASTIPAAAARYIRSGVRSEKELLAYLGQKGFSSDLAVRAVAECKIKGWVDDAACARLWTEHWARKGYAWSVIRAKLADKGLDERAIEEAASRLGQAVSGDEKRAREVAVSFLKRNDGSRAFSGLSRKKSLARALASKGFDQDLIERIVGESLGAPEEQDDMRNDV